MVETLVVKNGEPVGDDVVIDDPIIDDPDVDDDVVDDVDDDPDKPGEPDWMKDDDDSQASSDTMPISAHIRAKRKLKGKIGEKDSEIEELRREIQELKSLKQVIQPKDRTLVRPNRDAFDTIEEYEAALDEYEDKRIESKFSVVQGQSKFQETQAKAVKKLNDAVDGHYLRADKLITESGISAETYRQADEIVRNAIEAVRPGFGNIIVDQIISVLGEGSEKVLYKIGRSKALRGELITLLSEDPHGLKATAFLGEQKAKLSLTTKRKSNAPPPSSEINGDSVTSSSERVFKKKYESAHNSGNAQAAYNAKKAAKAAGVDTSGW